MALLICMRRKESCVYVLLPRIVVFIFALDPTTTVLLLLPRDHCPSYKILQLALYSTATSYDVRVRIAAAVLPAAIVYVHLKACTATSITMHSEQLITLHG